MGSNGTDEAPARFMPDESIELSIRVCPAEGVVKRRDGRVPRWHHICAFEQQIIFWRWPMDALELLKEDHQRVKELFERGQKTDDKKQRRQIFKEIKAELETHARIEETIFYPAMEEFEELKEMVLESLEEHKQMKTVLREMARLSASSERFKPKFKVLKDNVEHHAEEEEEGKMFPKIRKLVDRAQLEELGQELEAAKHRRLRKAS
jgi:hemerythrin superfamily protein